MSVPRTYARPLLTLPEQEQLQIDKARQERGSNALVQGWQSTSAGMNAGDLGELALAAEQAGDPTQAAGLLRRMRVAQAQSQAYAPDTRSVGDVNSLGTAADWAGGALGSMARSAAPAMGAGLAGAGAGALIAGPAGALAGGVRGFGTSLLRGLVTTLPTAAVSYDQLRGEQVAQQYDDPEVMKRSADERASQASQTAALQTVPEIFLPTRAVGAVLERQIAGQAGKRVANTALDAVVEGGTEVAQQELGFQGQQALGSTAERNPMEYLDAFAAGAVGGAGVSGTSNVLGAVGDKIATLSQPVAGESSDKEVLGAAGSKAVDKAKDIMSKPWSQTVAEVMTPDKAIADSLNGNQNPDAIAAAVTELDQTVAATAESMADSLLKQDRVSAGDKARLAQLKGSMADPVARSEVGAIAVKTKVVEVLDTAFKAVTGYVKSGIEKARSKFSMEGMDIAPLVDILAPLFGEKSPAMAQKWVDLASKYEGITSAEAITNPKLADSLDEIADVLGAMGKNGEGIKKALAGVGMTSMTKLIDELQSVPGAQADLGKQDSFLRTMLQKGPRGVDGKKVARLIDRLAPTIDNAPKEERAGVLRALSVAFGSDEAADAVLKYYVELHRAKPAETTLEAFKKQTDTLSPNAGSSFERPSQAEAEALAGGLTEGDFANQKASYRDSNPARPFFAMSDRKELKAEAAKGGLVAGMDEYVRRTGRSAAEAFGRVKTDLEQRLKASRNRDKAWVTAEAEKQMPVLEAKQQEFAAARAAYDAADAAGASKAELEVLGAKLPTLQQRDEVAKQIATLEKRLLKAEVRTDLPKLERQYAKMLRDTPAPEDMNPKRFDKALSRYRVVLRDETDTQASDEDVHRFQRLLRVRKAIKPPAKPKDPNDTEAKADYEDRLADYEAKVGAIDETTLTFTKTDGKKLKTSAESMTYASQVKGGDLQKFLSAVSSMLDRKDVAGVELPATLTIFRQGEKRQRRTLAEMRGIAKVRKQLQARAESGNPKQKAFAEQALALIEETSGQSAQRAERKAKKLGPTSAKRAENKAAEKSARAVADNRRDTATRAGMEGIREERAAQELAASVTSLREAEADLKELWAKYRAADPKAARDIWPQIEDQKEQVAALKSEERVLSEIVREWLDKVHPMPKSQEYTSFLADDVQMEGGYTEDDLRAAYLDEAIGVLEERLAAVREPLSKRDVATLFKLNDDLRIASAKEAPAIVAKIDALTGRFDVSSTLVDGILADLNAKKAELNELMDSTGRNPRDGSRRVKDNPSREPSAAVRAEYDDLAQSLMSAELNPKTIPLVDMSFQGKIDELRKKGGVDAAEMLRAYQQAMGRLRRIKDKTRSQSEVVFDKVTGKQKDANPISYTIGPDGKPQALPLDPATAYGRVEPDMRSETERSAEAQDHAAKARRVADAKLTTSTEKREDMTTLEKFNPLQRADFARRKAFKGKIDRIQLAAKKAREAKQKVINPEAAAQGADADKKSLAAREALKGMGRTPVTVKGELNSAMLRTVPGEALAMATSQLKARQEQVVKVVDVLTETLKRMFKNRTDSEATAGSVDLLERLERIGSQTPAIPKGFTGAREGRQSSGLGTAPGGSRTVVDEKSTWRSKLNPERIGPAAESRQAVLSTKAPEFVESDIAATDKEIARSRARLKLAQSKRPNEETWPAGYEEKMQQRKAAALKKAATQSKEKASEEEQGQEQGRREEGRREEVLKGGVKLPQTSPYAAKDQAKSDRATKFIGRGSSRSSTAAYAAAWGERANSGAYTADDAVFISAEGNRTGRVAPNWGEVKKAIDAGATIITDVPAARNRPYNIGERAVADFLSKNGYAESAPGTWTSNTTKQNAQSAGSKKVPTTLKKLKDELLRMRGKDVKLAVTQLLSGYGKYERIPHGPLVERLITIAHAAPNKMSVLYHEALHDFFAELGKDPATLRIKQQLLDAASTGHVQAQLRELLKGEPAALAQLSDPEERLAYMFQFRMANPEKMRIGPNTDTLFQRIAAAIRKFTGMITELEKAEQILLALHDGRLADPSTAAEVMAKWQTAGDTFQRYAGPVKQAMEKMVSASTDQLRAMNIPAFNTIADMFEDNVKKSGLLTARAQSGGIWRYKLGQILKGHDEKEIKAAMVHMQSMKDPVTDLHKKLAEFFVEIRQWQIKKGVKRFAGVRQPPNVFDGTNWVVQPKELMYDELPRVKNYFPRVWDIDMLSKHGDKFSRLLQKHMGYSQAQADDVLHQLRVGDSHLVKTEDGARLRELLDTQLGLTPVEIGEIMIDLHVGKGPKATPRERAKYAKLLVDHAGMSQADAETYLKRMRVSDVGGPKSQNKAGFSPYAQAVMGRELIMDEAGAAALAEFQSQDFSGVMTRYIDQAVHRAEYAERFGNMGEGLDELMAQAEKEGATGKQIDRAKRLISGLDGTIHRDMNPTIKQTQMALLTLQNLILLPLAVFSQLIDPLGVAVRSGDVRDAGAAYKRVLTDITQWASPKPDRAREMAQIIGAVQNDSVLQAMGMVHNGMYMSAGLRSINNFMFKYNGMQGINNSFRTAAVTAAEKYILEHRNDARRMEELDLKPADIVESKPGEIDYSSERIQQALFRFADGAVVRPNAAHRPLWMSDPRFMLVAHLKQFAFSFQQVILKRVAHEASYGNSGPLKVLAMYAPIMIAADMAKWALTGNLPQNWSLLHLFAHGVHRSGLLGVGTFGADVVNDVVSERSAVLGFLGPTAQHLGLLASWIGGGVPVEDVIDRSVPLARLFTK